MTGANAIADQLRRWGVGDVFGLPGTQNASFYCALAEHGLRWVPAMHEMGSGFAALGYAATARTPAVLALIGGPGFSYAITPLLEAKLDSIPLLVLVFARFPRPGRAFGSQEIDHVGLGRACCKQVLVAEQDDQVLVALQEAWSLANSGEPGPVMVLVESEYLGRPASLTATTPTTASSQAPSTHATVSALEEALKAAERPVFLAGRGALGGARWLRQLSEQFQAPVLTTTSARGIVSEAHPLVLRSDLMDTSIVNDFLSRSDRIFAWGIKFSHNAAKGYALKLPADKFVHIDSAPHVMHANFPAALTCVADVPEVLRELSHCLSVGLRRASSLAEELPAWRAKLRPQLAASQMPAIVGVNPPSPVGFFTGLRGILADDSILVLDSGFHQNLTRALYPIHSPHGLLLPTGLQSMGFALPAAIGAALAAPDRRVVALLGDGGLRMCGMELLSAVQRHLPILVILFDDGYYGLIRQQQISLVGESAAVKLQPMDYEAWTLSLQVAYFDGSEDPLEAVRQAGLVTGPSLVHVPLRDTMTTQVSRFKSTLKSKVGKIRRRGWF